MSYQLIKGFLIFMVGTILFSNECLALDDKEQRHVEVSLRMIGHQVLLNFGDSTSRVMPIKKNGDRYTIPFESEFEFNPSNLVSLIDSFIVETNIASSYLVEVQNCNTNEVVYSYEVGTHKEWDVIPCGPRDYPKDCYNLAITILTYPEPLATLESEQDANSNGLPSDTKKVNYSTITSLLVPLILLVGLFLFLWKRRRESKNDPSLIAIGAYQFDKRNMKLVLADDNIELTSKEADLLSLLYSYANSTLERDVILKTVWGDEGGYVGRTLDVFISKLRKKLQADPSIKIANIRGIGYKLVVNNRK